MTRLFTAGLVIAASVLAGCSSLTEVRQIIKPQSVVLLVTPKIIADFANPDADIARFFDRYKPLTSHASEVIVIFSVGNSDHILSYAGKPYWNTAVEWARTTDQVPVSNRVMDYRTIDGIVRAFRRGGTSAGINLKVYDQIDSGSEFTVNNYFKYVLHPECTANHWGMWDVRGGMQDDHDHVYAGAPSGIAAGTPCGDFLADQVGVYVRDLGFDGILYDNQLGTRGRWHEFDGPFYSVDEAIAIDAFLRRTRRDLAGKELMWFDSYNNVQIERNTFSFPVNGYDSFDYLIASGFCVTERTRTYANNLESKLAIGSRPRILATLDYVDPWYSYNSMTDYKDCSRDLEQTAIDYRARIDGIMFFANDETGALIPASLIESFAERFFAVR